MSVELSGGNAKKTHNPLHGRRRKALPAILQVLDDFVDLLIEPHAVFGRRRNIDFKLPLVILTVCSVSLFVLSARALEPIFEAEFARRIETIVAANPEITANQINITKSVAEKTRVLNYLVSVPLTVIASGIALWVLGKLAESAQTLRGALLVATYAQTPRLVEHLSSGIQGLFLDTTRLTSQSSISLGPARFVGAGDPVVLAILTRMDLFSIWVTVLFAIGMRVAGGANRMQAALVAFGVWLVSLGAVLLVTSQ